MHKFEVTAFADTNIERTIKAEYDFGNNLASMVALFGETVVFEHAFDNMVIAAQAFLRGRLAKGIEKGTGKRDAEKYKSDATILEDFKNWKPSTRKAADPVKKAENVKKAFSSMSAEDRARLLAELQKEAAATEEAKKPQLVKGGKNGRKAA
jgi:hypothetical protein